MPDTQIIQFTRPAWDRILRKLTDDEATLHAQLWREVRARSGIVSVVLDDERAAVVLAAARGAGVEVVE